MGKSADIVILFKTKRTTATRKLSNAIQFMFYMQPDVDQNYIFGAMMLNKAAAVLAIVTRDKRL
jgi:hypothetical protein